MVSLWADGQLIGSALANSSSTLITSNGTASLADGVRQFTATQQLPNQEASAPSSPLAVTIDTTAPTAPSSPALQAGSDTGISSSDRITQDTTPSFSVFASPYYRVYRNGTKVSGEYATGSPFTSSAQPDGTWDYTVTAVDAAGNESASSLATSVTIDTIAPAQPAMPDLRAACDSGVSDSDNITNNIGNQASLMFDLDAAPYFRFYSGVVRLSDLYATGSSFTTSYDYDGLYSYSVAAVDAAGNESTRSDALKVVVDRVAEPPRMPDLTPNSDSGISNSDNITSVTEPTFEVTVSEPGTIHLEIDGGFNSGAVLPVASPGTYSITLAPSTSWLTPYTAYGTAGHHYSVTVADLDADGHLDLIAANIDASSISVLLGNGDGTFKPALSIPASGRQLHADVADINGDGKLDLITTNGLADFSVFLGNGDGTFSAPITTVTAPGNRILVADFNGDGKADVLQPSYPNAEVRVFLSNGDGTFQSPRTIVVPAPITYMKAADLNGDGKLDVAATTGTNNLVTVMLGEGNGTFQPSGSYVVNEPSGSGLELRDFNNDGKPDIVTCSQRDGQIAMFAGKGDGTFNPAVKSYVGYAAGLFAADYNNDGKLDLLSTAVDNTNLSAVCISYGNGNGTFQPPVRYDTQVVPYNVAGGDFNSDGYPDAAAINYTDSSVFVYVSTQTPLRDGTHTFRAWFEDRAGNRSQISDGLTITLDTTAPNAPTLFDLQPASDTGASNTDNLTNQTTLGFDVSASPYYRVYRDGSLVSGAYQMGATCQIGGNPDGVHSFTVAAVDAAGNVSVPSSPLQVTVDTVAARPAMPDLQASSDSGISDSDDLTSYLDLIFQLTAREPGVVYLSVEGMAAPVSLAVGSAGSYSLPVRLQQLGFLAGVIPQPGLTIDMKSADVNLDGYVDLVTLPAGQHPVVAMGTSDGTFQTPLPINGSGVSFAIADFNRDGKPDLALSGTDLTILLGNGDGTFAPAQAVQSTPRGHELYTGDLNADGVPDILTCSRDGDGFQVLLGNGDGTFRLVQQLPTGPRPRAVVVADVNGDRRADILYAGGTEAMLSVYLSNADGTLQLGSQMSLAMEQPGLFDLGPGDFNEDGRLDVVISGTGKPGVLLLGQGDGSFAVGAHPEIPLNPSGLAVGDIDGDGHLDFATAGQSNQDIWVLRGQGDGTFHAPDRYPVAGCPWNLHGVQLNADDRIDFVFCNGQTSSLTTWLNGPLALPDGPHHVTVWLEDIAGNVSPLSEPLTFTLDATPPTADIAGVSPDPLTGRVDSITLTFSEPVAGLDLDDLKLSCDGGPNLLSTAQSFTTTDNRTWTLGNLAALTGSQGAYTLTLATTGSGITDRAGNALIADVTKCFALSNTPPVIQPMGRMWGMVGKPLAFYIQATDSDLPAQSLTFEMLDGPAGARVDSATGLFSWTPAYNDAEEHAATVRATDSGSPPLSTIRTIDIVILDAVVNVEDVKTTPSGFDIAFHSPIDMGPLNLYDGTDAAADLPDLTVVGQNTGPVHGSVVLDGIRRTLHWVKTGGPMMPDIYTLTLFGRPEGFYTLDIDGDGIAGGNYVTTAQWSGGSARVLSLPDIARGPSQSMQLPIRIDNAAGMQSISFEFSYDPALLSLGGIELVDLPPGWLMTSSEVAPGRVVVAAHGTIAVSGGAKNLFQVNANVPANALYGAAGLLKLDNVKADESIAAIGDTAVQAVAYLGDASGNKAYSGVDAAYMANVSIGAVSGFDAFPLIDPVIIGDVNGNGSIGGLDASYVAQKSVGMAVSQIPDLPAATPAARAMAVTNTGARPTSIPLAQRPLLPRIQRPALFVPWVRKVSEGLFCRRAIEPEILN